MRRNPARVPQDFAARPPQTKHPKPQASDDAGRLTPFLVQGGKVLYLLVDGPPLFDPRPNAVQLITSVYINKGEIGFLKSIRVAPYMPALFGSDPVTNDVLRWRAPDPAGLLTPVFDRPPSTGGLWQTPGAWEAYYDALDPEAEPPRWRWHLRAFQGTIEDLRASRRNVPAFDPAVPASWFMVENIPVPAATYAGGLPGKPIGYPFPGQRYQILQGDGLDLHIPVQQDHTLCLFAVWKQTAVFPYTETAGGVMLIDNFPHYPLLPSYGQLAGYSLPDSSEQARELARMGW